MVATRRSNCRTVSMIFFLSKPCVQSPTGLQVTRYQDRRVSLFRDTTTGSSMKAVPVCLWTGSRTLAWH